MKAKAQEKMGILFHFQNTLPLERDLELVDVYHALGVRVIQLTYNVKNFVGDGCAERTDAGLSDLTAYSLERGRRRESCPDLEIAAWLARMATDTGATGGCGTTPRSFGT